VYILLKKDGAQISEIYTLPTPSTTDNQLTEFLAKIQAKTKQKAKLVKIDLDKEIKK